MTIRRRLLSAVATSVALASLVACGADDSGEAGTVTVRVLAAASLTEVFTELGTEFEKDHPGTTVELSFGPSSGLAEQIDRGAPADVFASASPANMDAVVEAGHAERPTDFARNSMEIAVPPENPGDVRELADLTRRNLKVAVCQVEVPCGRTAAEVFASAGLTVEAATEETDVKAVLTKVRLGEVDAGVVYETDVRAAGDDVRGVAIPEEHNASTRYPIAALTGSQHPETAQEFVDLVLSTAGAKVLAAAGFQRP
jgi:molybdate transport system substrate-binding protein